MSHPGTRHEVSSGLDVGATRCPVFESVNTFSEESAKEGCHEGGEGGGVSRSVSGSKRYRPRPVSSSYTSGREAPGAGR